MRLYLLFLILNTFYKNVEPLSIFVKIEWQQDWENKFNYSDYLSGKITERFELKLTRNLFGDVNEFDGKTDGYDTYHFTGSDAIGEAQWIYNLNISIDGFQIIDPFKVENNSIVYIALSKDNAKYKILKKSQELSHFDAIINLFKNPIRFLQFVLRKRGEEVEDIRVLCKDVEQNIAELVKVFKGEKENYNSRREYRSNCVRIKVCPNNSYILFSHGKHLKKIEAKELKCNSAKFVSEINPYLIDYGYSGLVTSCVLQNSFQGNKNDCIDKTSEEDTETSKIISEIFYRNEKDWKEVKIINHVIEPKHKENIEELLLKKYKQQVEEGGINAAAAAREITEDIGRRVRDRDAQRYFKNFKEEFNYKEIFKSKTNKRRKEHNFCDIGSSSNDTNKNKNSNGNLGTNSQVNDNFFDGIEYYENIYAPHIKELQAQLLNESSAVQTIKPHELDAESHTNSNNIGEGASTMTNVKNVYVKNDNLKNDNVKNVNVIAKSSLDDGEMIDLTNTLNWDDDEPQDLGSLF